VLSNVTASKVVLETPAGSRLVLTGQITLQSAEAIHAKLLEVVSQPVVEIDLGGATEVDLSLVQLILAARLSAERLDGKFTLSQPASGPLLETLRSGGFSGADGDEAGPDQAFWFQVTGTK